MPESYQAMVCHSFPGGNGLHGTNMKPGKVYLLTYFIVDSYKHERYMGENVCPLCDSIHRSYVLPIKGDICMMFVFHQ